MSISETHLSYKFKLQPKPDGGYTAISDDPPCTIEGATREEVEQKMREKIMEQISPEIASKLTFSAPGVKLRTNIKFNAHIGGARNNAALPGMNAASSLDGAPHAEPVVSPKLLVLIGALVTILVLVWRLTAHS
ncbi:MAG: type II toxin-antitoxin system HicB family antitoxin [Terriglobales bacterium]